MSVATVSTFNKKFQFPPQPFTPSRHFVTGPSPTQPVRVEGEEEEGGGKKNLISYFKVIKSDKRLSVRGSRGDLEMCRARHEEDSSQFVCGR